MRMTDYQKAVIQVIAGISNVDKAFTTMDFRVKKLTGVDPEYMDKVLTFAQDVVDNVMELKAPQINLEKDWPMDRSCDG